MKMIDISDYQGIIDWQKVSATPDLTGVILRSTRKNGQIDNRFKENYDGIRRNMNDHFNRLDFYKFTYARNYIDARIEAFKTIKAIYSNTQELDFLLWLDLEDFDGRPHTKRECDEVITAYLDAAKIYGVKIGLYFDRNYALNFISHEWAYLPTWIARYNSTLGDVTPFKPELWQYTSSGHIDGIKGNVDINEVL